MIQCKFCINDLAHIKGIGASYCRNCNVQYFVGLIVRMYVNNYNNQYINFLYLNDSNQLIFNVIKNDLIVFSFKEEYSCDNLFEYEKYLYEKMLKIKNNLIFE